MGYLESVLSRVPEPVRRSIEQIVDHGADYPIRTHHLVMGSFPEMARLVGLEKPGGIVQAMVLIPKLNRVAHYCADLPKDNEFYRWYATDVVGENNEHAGAFERVMAATYLAFLHLDEDHPVVVSGNPDLVCKACFRGEHCQGGTFLNVRQITPSEENSITRIFCEGVGGDARNLDRVDGVLRFRTDVGTVKKFLGK